jgi:hypothetical protein
MAAVPQKVYILFAVLISAFILILPEFGSPVANASQESSQPEAADLQIQPSSLITFTPTFTNFLPVVVNAKPSPAPSVSVVSSSAYDNGYGDLHIVGEVINNTPDNVTLVRVTATLHNSGGDILRSSYSHVLIDILAPSQKGPFKIYFSDYPPEYTTYRLSIDNSTTTESAKRGVSVLSSSTWPSSFGSLYTAGEVQNGTSGNIEFVKVVATYYDAASTVTNVDYTYSEIGVLGPGQKGPFKISTSQRPYNSYTFSVEFDSTALPAKTGVSVLNSDTWVSGYGSLYTVGEAQNDTSGNLRSVKVVGTYYDAAGAVTNVDYAYALISVLGPGQKGPFKISAADLPYDFYTFSIDYSPTTDLPPSGTSVKNLDIWTEFGSTQFTGEVQNDSGNNIRFVEVIATSYDNAGTVADVNSTYLPVEILGSSRKGCFRLYGTGRPYSSYSLFNDFSVTTDPLPSLEVLSITPSGDLHLAGQIRNNHASETYNFVKAVSTLYDGAGKVLNCESSYTSPSELGPGEVAPYDINFYSHTSGWASYEVVATD